MPIRTIADIRASWGPDWEDASDEEVLKAYSDAAKLPMGYVADQVGYDPGKGSITREQLSASADSYQSGMYGLGEAVTGALGMDGASRWLGQRRESNQVQADVAGARAGGLGAVQRWDDVHGVGDFGSYAKNLAIQSVPYAAEFMIGGTVARAGSTGLKAAVNAGRALDAAEDTVTAARLAQKALDTRSVIGGVAASYPSAVADILQNQREEPGGQTDLLSAVAGGVPYAGLNALGVGGSLAKGGLTRNVVSAMDRGGARYAAGRMGLSVGRSALEEGAGEVGQEMINQAGRVAVNPDAEMFGAAALDRYKESAIGGAVLGGTFGGVGGWRRSDQYQRTQEDALRQAARAAKEPSDILATVQMDPSFKLEPSAEPFGPWQPPAPEQMAAADTSSQYDMFNPNGTPTYGADNSSPMLAVAETRDALRGPAGLAPQEQINQSTGVSAEPYANRGYPGQFNAAASEPTGNMLPSDVLHQQEYPENRLQQVQVQAGVTDEVERIRQEQRQLQEKIDAAAAKAEQKRSDAHGVLVDQMPDGKPAVKLKPREINTYATLKNLTEQGVVSRDKFAELVGELKEALRAEDNKTLNRIAKDAAAMVPANKEAADVGARDLSGAGLERGGAAGGVDAQGSVAAAGPEAGAVGPQPVVPAGVQAPTGKAAVQPAQPATQPAAAVAPRSAVIGGQIDFGALQQLLEASDPKLYRAALYHLGVDAKGHRLDKPMSLQAAAHAAGMGAKSHSRLSKALTAIGVTKAEKDRFATSYSDANIRRTDMTDAEQAAYDAEQERRREIEEIIDSNEGVSGRRVGAAEEVTNMLDQPSGDLSDAQTNSAKAQAGLSDVNSAGGSRVGTAAIKNRNIKSTSFWKKFEKNGLNDWLPQPGETAAVSLKKAKDLAALISGLSAYNMSIPANGQAAVEIYNQFESLVKSSEYKRFMKQVSVEMVAIERAVETKAEQEIVTDETFQERDGKDAGAGEESGGRNAGDEGDAERAPAGEPVVTRKKRRSVERPQFSRGGTGAPATATSLWEQLNAWLPLDPARVTIVDSVEQLPRAAQKSIGDQKDVQAFVLDGHAYLIADQMDAGNARGVLLHEVGAHMGLEGMLTMKQYRELSERIVEWAESDAKSKERAIAQAAVQRVAESGETDAIRVKSELIAYFIEEAVKAGVEPSATAPQNSVARWLHEIFQAFQRAFEKFVRGAADLNAQDIVDMAYGAAQMEMVEGGQASEGGLKGPAPQFSKAAALAAVQEVTASAEAIEKLHEALNQKSRDGMTNMAEAVRKHLPAWMTNHQIMDQWGKKLTSLEGFVGTQQKMTKARNEMSQRSHELAVRWEKLPDAVRAKMEAVMFDATMKGIDPDEKFGEGVNAHLSATDKAAYDALKNRFNALTAQAQGVYRAARDELALQWTERQNAYNKTVTEEYDGLIAAALERDDATEADRLRKEAEDLIKKDGKLLSQLRRGPYFPLMRFGEYLAVGKSKEFVDTEAAIKDATGEERRALEENLDGMKRDQQHYVVSAHETKARANEAERTYKAKGLTTYQQLTDQHLDSLSRGSQHHLSALVERATVGLDSAAASEVRTALTRMYLQSLPEMHALRREAERKGVEGASRDMLRAYAASSETNAFFTSRLLHAKDLSATLFEMKAQAKGDTNLQHVHREMEKRLALDMTYKRTPVQDAISSMSWLYHLGISPSFMVINSTQPWLVTAPVLAGKYGVGRTVSALRKASVDAMAVLKAARMKDGKWDPWSGISEDTLPDTSDGNVRRKMIRELMRRGILDEGQQHDLNMYASDSSRGLAKFNRVMGWTTQQIELVNRLSTALAAFDLAYTGKNYDEAVKAAYDTTMDTQFDYSSEGSARVMREGGGVPLAKLVFQFRRYQQAMIYLLASNAKKAFAGDKQALSSLAYLTATSGIAAGALGLPLIGSAFALANLFLDDDDPEGDAETHLRNWLFDITGDKDAATVLAKGIPAAFGMDLSKRIGLGDIASPFPMAKFENKNGKEDVKEALFNAVGPAAGMASNIWEGMLRMQAGDWGKGVEKIAPKFLADAAKAVRYAEDGMSDSKGNPTGTNLNEWDVLLRGAGIAPIKESNYYEGTRAIKQVETATKDRLGKIGERYKAALRDGEMGDVRAMIDEFNADHPQSRITPKMEMQWRKDARSDVKGRAPESGIKKLTGRDAAYNNAGRFAL